MVRVCDCVGVGVGVGVSVSVYGGGARSHYHPFLWFHDIFIAFVLIVSPSVSARADNIGNIHTSTKNFIKLIGVKSSE